MDVNGEGFYNWLITGIVGVGGLLISWLMNRSIAHLDRDIDRHNTTLDEHSKLHAACSLELAEFKTEVATRYAREETLQLSLSRIHDRLDKLPGEIIHLIKSK